jgi:hypothetical protein
VEGGRDRGISEYFAETQVHYAIKGGIFHRWGLRSWSLKHPGRTALSMVGNFINSLESTGKAIRYRPKGTHHLIAFARKPLNQSGDAPLNGRRTPPEGRITTARERKTGSAKGTAIRPVTGQDSGPKDLK